MGFDVKVLGFVLIGASLAVTVAMAIGKRVMFSKLERSFSGGDFDGCLALLDKPYMRYLFPPYNRLYLRLNADRKSVV